MQLKYLGDVADWGKFALLRHLCGTPGHKDHLQLGYHMHLVDGDEVDNKANTDGGVRAGKELDTIRVADPELATAMKTFAKPSGRNLDGFVRSGVLPCPSVVFDAPLTFGFHGSADAKLRHRIAWHSRAFDRLSGADLVFVDPDTGLGAADHSRTSAKALKYVFGEELRPHLTAKQSLVVIQFAGKLVTVPEYIADTTDALRRSTYFDGPMHVVRFHHSPTKLFFVLAAKSHARMIQARLDQLASSRLREVFRVM